MKKLWGIGIAAVIGVLGLMAYFGSQRWDKPSRVEPGDLLSLLPADASAVFFADFHELRRAPFMEQLYAWAPKPQVDSDYREFAEETGFDYERDLDHIAIAVEKRGQDTTLFAVVDGKFHKEKISAYASKTGSVTKNSGREILAVPVSGSKKGVSFAFLRNDRMALTNDADLGIFLNAKPGNRDTTEWHSRFERLAGSPVFAVIRQDAVAGATFLAQAPGGLGSPQLSTLLDQLQWITLAGKPENDRLRVVAEGECVAEATVGQLADLLNGVVLLARAGLNDAKTRGQLDPAVREAYLELLRSADASKIDRGETKSVRLVFEVTPKFLEAAHTGSPVPTDRNPAKPPLPRTNAPKKGHI